MEEARSETLTCRWALCLPPDMAESAAGLRLEPGIDALESSDAVWLRLEGDDERMQTLLQRLPGGRRFEILGDRQLRPAGSRLPQGHLPQGIWQKLRAWAGIELPRAALPAQPPERHTLALIRGGAELAANVVLTDISTWRNYALTAPQIRLDRLRFAASPNGYVVVHGNPLPPIAGTLFSEAGGIATPCGWNWSPEIDSQTLQTLWGLNRHDLALVRTDQTWDLIRSDQFVRATRSGVRAM